MSDKIEGLGPGAFLFRSDLPHQNKKEKVKKGTPGSFSQLFQTSDSQLEFNSGEWNFHELQENPEKLRAFLVPYIDTIHERGDALSSLPSRQNLSAYRESLSLFLKIVGSFTYTTEEHKSSREVLNQKKYIIIKRIDEKLENLALGILTEQAEKLKILAQVEEINGLLFDLLH
ncbi:MAG: DUF327 family protein [Spirochaetales bacterium]|nr:DUF327 family protein [Spirochaetales bacterium]